MKLIHASLLALLLATTAQAQTPKPARPARPPVPAAPAVPATPMDSDQDEATTDEEQLAIAALEGLMMQPSARALPILKKVLAGAQPTVVKRRALFSLSQIDSPEARDILMQTARTNPALRADAVRSIGIGGNAKSLEALSEIYKTGDEDSQKEILQAWMIAGRKDLLFQVAVNAKTEDEASEAIRMLGVMGATDELRKLGDKPTSPKGLLDAYAISGDLAGLRKIVDGAAPKEVRVDAVSRIGIIQNDAAKTALREIYAKSTDADIREAALQGMLIAQDEQGVLALYRAAKTVDEKRALLRTLSMMDSDAALQAIDATLEKKP